MQTIYNTLTPTQAQRLAQYLAIKGNLQAVNRLTLLNPNTLKRAANGQRITTYNYNILVKSLKKVL